MYNRTYIANIPSSALVTSAAAHGIGELDLFLDLREVISSMVMACRLG